MIFSLGCGGSLTIIMIWYSGVWDGLDIYHYYRNCTDVSVLVNEKSGQSIERHELFKFF